MGDWLLENNKEGNYDEPDIINIFNFSYLFHVAFEWVV